MGVSRPGFISAVLCAALALSAGCKALSPREGRLECDSEVDCPPGWLCNAAGDRRCYSDEDRFPERDAGPDADTDSDSDADGDSDSDTDTDADSDTDAEPCLGLAAVYDFETGDQGFVARGLSAATAAPFVLGEPTGGCHSGTACFATNLTGDYGTCASGEITRAVDLSACQGSERHVEIRFWHYYRFEDLDGSQWHDGGNIQFSIDGGQSWLAVTPDPAYQGTLRIAEGTAGGRACEPPAPQIRNTGGWSGLIPGDAWIQVTVDIPDQYRASSFMFRFLFGSDNQIIDEGWRIDDVEVAVY